MDKKALIKTIFFLCLISLFVWLSCKLINVSLLDDKSYKEKLKHYEDSTNKSILKIIRSKDSLNYQASIQIQKLRDSVSQLTNDIDEINGQVSEIQKDNNEKIIRISRMPIDSVAMFIAARYKNK